ncbi:hypothetical protein VTN00DRAFT_10057 [Thermoascus crustaceus]|uniref:uncharacterized protein n=1 Tax=Thermoascus crustaceus TaxID=5088 RepID=UPI0037446B9A
MSVLTQSKHTTTTTITESLISRQFEPEHKYTLRNARQDVQTNQSQPQNFFYQWRPSYHLLAPHGWMNDPCGPGYDPTTGVYHLAFQWNPHGNDWGNISWGHATSRDLASWKTSPEPCLTPSAPYDHEGIFTGCFRPTGLTGETDGTLTYVYTSVSHLPISYTLPYVRGSETLSLAVSHDSGKTWERDQANPILPGPPDGVNVTGWRDPFITSWPSMQAQRHTNRSSSSSSEEEEDVLYGFISGGIVNKTPTVFVYSINAKDLREWTYIGPLMNVGLNFRPSKKWSGDFGANWEVANVVTLTDEEDGESRDFIIMGTEGVLPTNGNSNSNNTDRPKDKQQRTLRSQLWMSGTLLPKFPKNKTSPLMKPTFSGTFDHGPLYAANSFHDPISNNRIVYGWITEEDLPDDLRHRQGWSGLISLPRVVKLSTLRRVKKARMSELRDITSIEAVPDGKGKGTYTVRTLGVVPDRRLERLRVGARRDEVSGMELRDGLQPGDSSLPLTTARWELDAEFTVGSNCTRVGFVIFHSADHETKTTLTFNPQTETIRIDRPRPFDPRINHDPESAPHTLFTYIDPRGEEVEEPLRIHAFYDTSVLEVFVNGRTVISTRVYVPDGSRCYGVRFFAERVDDGGDGGGSPAAAAAVLQRAVVWDGLGME